LQNPEQQSAPVVQALPSVLQLGLRVAHLPAVQVPLQHWVLVAHAKPSEVQPGNPQAPLLHTPLQQIAFELQLFPSDSHPPSLPNGLPPSPTFPPLLLVLPPLLLVLPPLLLVLPPLVLPLPPLLDVASPPSLLSPPPALLLLPQAMNELPLTSPTRTATHTTSALRRRDMRSTLAGVIPARPTQ
jgi:hypothetical protein